MGVKRKLFDKQMNKPSVFPVDLMDFARTVSQRLLDKKTEHVQFQDLELFPLSPGNRPFM